MTTQTAICLIFLMMLSLVVYVKPPPEEKVIEKPVIVKEVQLVEKPVVVEKVVEKMVEKKVEPSQATADRPSQRGHAHSNATRVQSTKERQGGHKERMPVPWRGTQPPWEGPTDYPCR